MNWFKRLFWLMLACLSVFLSVGCSKTVIPTSVEAKEKLEKLGYSVSVNVNVYERTEDFPIAQITTLTADKNGDVLQAYFFTCKEDTDAFFKLRATSLSKGVEVIKKNKYSIYRGSAQSVAELLS